jgi:hypothetical protein
VKSYFLLDPGEFEAPQTDDAEAWTRFWLGLIRWEGDGRVKIGTNSLGLAMAHGICEHVEAEGFDFPPHSRRDRRSAVYKLLSRVANVESPGRIVEFEPRYLGAREFADALARDLTSCTEREGGAVVALATRPERWKTGTRRSACQPPPPTSIELCMHPNDAVGQERLLRSRSWLKGRRLHIVGGRSEDRILSDIADCLGVPPENVDWESCELRKKPKLSSWTNLRADRDVAVCITGHIGHASSEKALELAGRARVVCLSVRCGGDIVEGLQAMCADRGPGVGE